MAGHIVEMITGGERAISFETIVVVAVAQGLHDVVKVIVVAATNLLVISSKTAHLHGREGRGVLLRRLRQCTVLCLTKDIMMLSAHINDY